MFKTMPYLTSELHFGGSTMSQCAVVVIWGQQLHSQCNIRWMQLRIGNFFHQKAMDVHHCGGAILSAVLLLLLRSGNRIVPRHCLSRVSDWVMGGWLGVSRPPFCLFLAARHRVLVFASSGIKIDIKNIKEKTLGNNTRSQARWRSWPKACWYITALIHLSSSLNK